MENVCGLVTISFTAKISKRKLVDDFDTMLLKDGSISILNIEDEQVEMEVMDYEFDVLDEGDC